MEDFQADAVTSLAGLGVGHHERVERFVHLVHFGGGHHLVAEVDAAPFHVDFFRGADVAGGGALGCVEVHVRVDDGGAGGGVGGDVGENLVCAWVGVKVGGEEEGAGKGKEEGVEDPRPTGFWTTLPGEFVLAFEAGKSFR